MKKQYTRKQITEAIAYWEKQLRAGNYRIVSESKDATRIEKALLKAAKENSWNDAVDFASHLAEVFNSDEYPHDLDKKQRIKELIEYFGNSKKCSYSTVADIVQRATDHAAEDAVDDQITMISRYVSSAKLLVACFQDYRSIDSLVIELINDASDEVDSMYKKLYDGFYYDISLDDALELCSRIEYNLDYVVDFKILNSISNEDKKREMQAAIDKANQAYSELQREFPDIDELRGY